MKARKPRYGTGVTTHLISLYALDRERAQYLMEFYSAREKRPIKLSELVRILITESAERLGGDSAPLGQKWGGNLH